MEYALFVPIEGAEEGGIWLDEGKTLVDYEKELEASKVFFLWNFPRNF